MGVEVEVGGRREMMGGVVRVGEGWGEGGAGAGEEPEAERGESGGEGVEGDDGGVGIGGMEDEGLGDKGWREGG
ncbi:hypothetical protein MU699_31570, partial [Pseudomonas aeruginosa]